MSILRRRSAVGSGGGGGPIVPPVLFGDTFDTDTRADYTYLAGAASDFSVVGGELAPASVSGAWKVAVPTSLAAGEDFSGCLKITPAGGESSGYAVVPKALDGANLLWASLDASTALVTIGKLDGGAQVSLLSLPGWAAGTRWLHVHMLGNHLLVRTFVNDPEAPDAQVASTGSYLLTGANAAKFGTGIAGKPGFALIAGNAAARFDEFRVRAASKLPIW